MKRKILRSRLFLYLTEFFSGMSVMAVELGASRLLAPYFSSSQIVWTIIIGTIMIAMALGNIYGGRRADRNPDPDRLYRSVAVAAVWIALIPVAGKYIIIGISGLIIFSVSTNFLIIAAFAACMIVFVFPLFLLGTVTPSLARFTVDSVDHSGNVVGTLGAFNTVGSIIGTFVPTFVSIPAVGTSVTFLIFAGILLALTVIYFFSPKQDGGGAGEGKKAPEAGVIAACCVFILCCVFGHDNSFAFWQNDLTYEGESIYNYLQVFEDDEQVVLSTNVLFGVQSVYRKDKSLTGMYYDYAMAAPFMAGVHEKDSMDVLILGMGTGTYATQCSRYFDGMNIEGVEIDEKITRLAREYFELPESISVTTYDGRAFLNACEKKYDIIMVDAYQDITIPFQMSSREFFRLVEEHLRDDGVMIVNMNMRGSSEGSINSYLADTVSSVFPCVYSADVICSSNVELFAAKKDDILARFDANRAMEKDETLRAMMDEVANRLVPYEQGPYLLTDDRAPVELLGMRVLDELILDEVNYYKAVYEERGFAGLIDSM